MKLSVIVPIYETERFLTRCLDSLVKQTFCDVEFILIDNGANEECKRIIDSYVHQYSRVKLNKFLVNMQFLFRKKYEARKNQNLLLSYTEQIFPVCQTKFLHIQELLDTLPSSKHL